MWKQLSTPNLDPVVYNGGKALNDWYGWCLATVETAFGTDRLYPTAWAGWQNTSKRHQDRDFPIGVYFPVWFSGYSNMGHVAIAYVNESGQMNIWTSPYTHVPYFYTGYHDVDTLANGYHVTYAGWSEDLAGSTLIEFVPDPPVPTYTVEMITPKQVVAPNGASKWNLTAKTWSEFSADGALSANTPVTVVALAHHVLGGQYYMENADTLDGYNIVDMQDYTPPVVTPPEPPVVTPPVVEPPTVTPPVEPPVTPPVIPPVVPPKPTTFLAVLIAFIKKQLSTYFGI